LIFVRHLPDGFVARSHEPQVARRRGGRKLQRAGVRARYQEG
jgi:hypothetical protein